ncbi:hypothetical protein [Rathayibacter rathayi]|uniref:hypothetical protein n=1 Tax=Rathayibacter rathayi TaxID=33887 RepID=UPI001F265FFF|nr:hypothetical protein [Rathayibacter rathayi]
MSTARRRSVTPDWAGTTFCDIGANTGVPTVSLPAGFTSTGAAGLELAAPRGEDASLLGMSYDYQQATPHRVAPVSTPELAVAEPTPEPTATPAEPIPGGTLLLNARRETARRWPDPARVSGIG